MKALRYLSIVCISFTLAGCGDKVSSGGESAAQSAGAEDSEEAKASLECETTGESCRRHGIEGTCFANRCVLPTGHCSQDIDCLDGNECSSSSCVGGSCEVVFPKQISCNAGKGECWDGHCLKPLPPACTSDAECELSTRICQSAECISGACVVKNDADGARCRQPSGASSTCSAGACMVQENAPRTGQTCRTVRTPYGNQRQCTDRLTFALAPADLRKAAESIEENVRDTLLYDVAVRLVPVADGGYNIVIFNRQTRDTVQGLLDPSFIAFEVATFTEDTAWKSRTLQIWIDAYTDGWLIPTMKTRNAVRKGRDASGLGALGVVHIKAFRSSLQQSFHRLPNLDADESEVAGLEGVAMDEEDEGGLGNENP